MMRMQDLCGAVRQIARMMNYRPLCCACNRPVETIAGEPLVMPDRTLKVVFFCHGKTEEIRLDPMGESPLKAWPKRLFLRNWAGCTIRPERPKVVRRL